MHFFNGFNLIPCPVFWRVLKSQKSKTRLLILRPSVALFYRLFLPFHAHGCYMPSFLWAFPPPWFLFRPPPRHPFATSFRFDYTTGAHLGGVKGKSVFLLDFVPLNRRWASSSFCAAVQLNYWSYHCSKLTSQKPLYFILHFPDLLMTYRNYTQKRLNF